MTNNQPYEKFWGYQYNYASSQKITKIFTVKIKETNMYKIIYMMSTK